MPPASPAPVRLVIAAFAVWLLGSSLVYPSATRIDAWPWAGLTAAGWMLALVFVLAGGLSFRLGGARDAAVAAFVLVAVASAWASPWTGGSLAASLAVPAGAALLYLLIGGFRHADLGPRLGLGLDLIATAVVVTSLAAWLVIALEADSLLAGLARRNDRPFGHANYTAAAALLATAWLGSRALATTGGSRRWRLVAAGMAAAVLLSSGSRAAVACLAAGAGIGLVAWWRRRGCRRRDAATGGLLLLGVLAAGIGTNERLRDLVRHGRWSPLAADSNQQRLALAQAGIELGLAHGPLGPGPGTVPLAYHAGDAATPAAPDGALQVHSAPLQVWATTGLAGAVALGLLIVSLLPAVMRAFAPAAPAPHTVLAAGLVAAGLFSLSDHAFDVPFILVFTLAPLAVLLAPSAIPAAPRSAAWRAGLAAAALVVLAGPLAARVRDLAARAAFAQAMAAYDAGDSPAVWRALAAAHDRAPWDRYYRETAAALRWESPEGRAEAADLLRSVLAGGGRWPSEFAAYNLAWLDLAAGHPDAAKHFALAARLAPHRRGVQFGLGLARARAGDREGAARALADACLADPLLVTEPVWSGPEFQPLWPRVSAEIATRAARLAESQADEARGRELRAVAARLRWWRDPAALPLDALLAEASPEAADALRAMTTAPAKGGGAWPGGESWGVLGETWAQGRPPAGFTPEQAGALQRQLESSADFAAFAAGALSGLAPWRQTERAGRGGYRVVMRHPDSAVLYDVPAFDRHLMLPPAAAALFPPRGWIPGQAWRRAGLAPDQP